MFNYATLKTITPLQLRALFTLGNKITIQIYNEDTKQWHILFTSKNCPIDYTNLKPISNIDIKDAWGDEYDDCYNDSEGKWDLPTGLFPLKANKEYIYTLSRPQLIFKNGKFYLGRIDIDDNIMPVLDFCASEYQGETMGEIILSETDIQQWRILIDYLNKLIEADKIEFNFIQE